MGAGCVEEFLPSTSSPVSILIKAHHIPQHHFTGQAYRYGSGRRFVEQSVAAFFALRGTYDKEACNCYSYSCHCSGCAGNQSHARCAGFLVTAPDVPNLRPVHSQSEVELFMFAERLKGSAF